MIAGKKLGRKAFLIGGLAQTIPDLDFVTAIWMDPVSSLVAHRGFTHSILFCLMVISLVWLTAWRAFPSTAGYRKELVLIMAVNLFVHIFLDAFNAYGTGWLEPFSNRRFAFHVLFVGDPLFSIGPLVAFLVLVFRKKLYSRRFRWAFTGIACSIVYLGYAAVNKQMIETDVTRYLKQQQIPYHGFMTTPTPLNSWLWYVIVRDSNGYHYGYRSVFDESRDISFTYFPSNHHLVGFNRDQHEMDQLIRFAQGYYTIENWNDTLVFNVLRFGQVIGWHDPKERFAFHYFLNRREANELVVQRGRFAKWDRETIGSLIRRIRGKKR